MGISRRLFIKGIAATVAMAAAPGLVAKTISDANNTGAIHSGDGGDWYGRIAPLTSSPDKSAVEEVIRKVLIVDARKTMGPGVVVEIRKSMSMDFGKSHGVAWVANDNIKRMAPLSVSEPEFNSKEGYYFCGRIRT